MEVETTTTKVKRKYRKRKDKHGGVATKADITRQKSGLSQKQYEAIDAILAGANDQEAANCCGVTRQTVNGWKNNDPEFAAELKRQRELLRDMHLDKLQVILGKALRVVEGELDDSCKQFKREAAFSVLKTLNSHLKDMKVKSLTDAGAS